MAIPLDAAGRPQSWPILATIVLPLIVTTLIVVTVIVTMTIVMDISDTAGQR